jgi:hypothetical protein
MCNKLSQNLGNSGYTFLLIGIFCCNIIVHGVNAQTCIEECIISMRNGKAPPRAINEFCCRDDPNAPRQTCYTSDGICPLLEPGPVESPCVCPGPYGPVPGQIGP